MNRKKASIIAVAILMLMALGVSFAYFLPSVTHEDSVSTISVVGATIGLTLTNGTVDKTITGIDIIPGWSDTKNFKVTVNNNSGQEVKYKLVFNYTNSFPSDELVYTLASTDTGAVVVSTSAALSNGSHSDEIGTGSFAGTVTEGSHNYVLTVSYPEGYTEQTQSNSFMGYVSLEAD